MYVTLADQILPLVRTAARADRSAGRRGKRTDRHRWRASNGYGVQLHDAVTLPQGAAENEPRAEVLAVSQKAIASACVEEVCIAPRIAGSSIHS